jgi:hypothetical protein
MDYKLPIKLILSHYLIFYLVAERFRAHGIKKTADEVEKTTIYNCVYVNHEFRVLFEKSTSKKTEYTEYDGNKSDYHKSIII